MQDLVKVGPNFTNVVQRSCTSKSSPNSPAHLGALEALVFLLFKYAFSWFPEQLITFKDISVLSNEDFSFATPVEINLIHFNVTAVLQNKGRFFIPICL